MVVVLWMNFFFNKKKSEEWFCSCKFFLLQFFFRLTICFVVSIDKNVYFKVFYVCRNYFIFKTTKNNLKCFFFFQTIFFWTWMRIRLISLLKIGCCSLREWKVKYGSTTCLHLIFMVSFRSWTFLLNERKY